MRPRSRENRSLCGAEPSSRRTRRAQSDGNSSLVPTTPSLRASPIRRMESRAAPTWAGAQTNRAPHSSTTDPKSRPAPRWAAAVPSTNAKPGSLVTERFSPAGRARGRRSDRAERRAGPPLSSWSRIATGGAGWPYRFRNRSELAAPMWGTNGDVTVHVRGRIRSPGRCRSAPPLLSGQSENLRVVVVARCGLWAGDRAPVQAQSGRRRASSFVTEFHHRGRRLSDEASNPPRRVQAKPRLERSGSHPPRRAHRSRPLVADAQPRRRGFSGTVEVPYVPPRTWERRRSALHNATHEVHRARS